MSTDTNSVPANSEPSQMPQTSKASATRILRTRSLRSNGLVTHDDLDGAVTAHDISAIRTPVEPSLVRTAGSRDGVVQPRPYLSLAQLADLVPWTEVAIRSMVARGQLRLGTHYFQPTGRGGSLVFSWRAIVDYIEGGGGAASVAGAMRNSSLGLNIDVIKSKAQELLG